MNTVVRKSPLDGRGLFARREFTEGETVEMIDGTITLGSRSKYAIPLRGGRSLLLTNKTKYVNSSPNPNVSFSIKKSRLIALRDISEGEELLSGYQSVFA